MSASPAAPRGPVKAIVQCRLKLKLRPSQERTLNRWLWHMTGVHNWAVKKIERDAEAGIYHSLYDLKAMLNGHSRRMGIPANVLQGGVVGPYRAWQACWSKRSSRPRLKGRRNRLNSILLTHSI